MNDRAFSVDHGIRPRILPGRTLKQPDGGGEAGFKHCRDMSSDQAEDYLYAKLEQSQFLDAEPGREQGLAQFLDEKRIGLGSSSTSVSARPIVTLRESERGHASIPFP
jgi:hypothetical protein